MMTHKTGMALGMVAAVVLTTIGFGAHPAAARTPALRVMTYNIHHGHAGDVDLDAPKKKSSLNETIKVLKKYHPDVLGLQEISVDDRKLGNCVNQVTKIAKALNMHYTFRGTVYKSQGRVCPGKKEAKSGIALLFSKKTFPAAPIFENFTLTKLTKPGNGVTKEDIKLIAKRATRYLTTGTVKFQGKNITFYNSHFTAYGASAYQKNRIHELKSTLARIKANKKSSEQILMGDLNMELKAQAEFRKQLGNAKMKSTGNLVTPKVTRTFPVVLKGTKKAKVIDYVLITNGLTVSSAKAIPKNNCSDHLPYYATISVKR